MAARGYKEYKKGRYQSDTETYDKNKRETIKIAEEKKKEKLEKVKTKYDEGTITNEKFNAENKKINAEYNSAVKEANKAFDDRTKEFRKKHGVGVEHGHDTTKAALAKGVSERAKKKETAKTKKILEELAKGDEDSEGGGEKEATPNN